MQSQRHIADFIEEQHPTIGFANFADIAVFIRAGKGPRLIAEKLRFNQRFWNGRAVDGDKFTAAPAAMRMQFTAEELFAAAGFAFDTQRDTGVEQADHFLAFAGRAKRQVKCWLCGDGDAGAGWRAQTVVVATLLEGHR